MTDQKIFLIHATQLAIQPVTEVFQASWPQARCCNLLDDSLTGDLEAAGKEPSNLNDRFINLATYARDQGAQGILFTCSAFGPAIEAAQQAHALPILKPNEAMLDQALDLCQALGGSRRIGLLTTFAPATAPMRAELEAAVRQRSLPVEIATACAVGAIERLNAGDAANHDQLVQQAARQLAYCDVLLLGQFSMARCQAQLASVSGQPVLTSPASAVRLLRSRLGAVQ
jgi:Asp/Glu/hydantoin racemase